MVPGGARLCKTSDEKGYDLWASAMEPTIQKLLDEEKPDPK